MRKNEEEVSRLKAEREAHQKAAQQAETEARDLDRKRDAIRAEREANEAAMARLEVERKSLSEQRQASDEVARANKEEAVRLEAQREALGQQECRVNRDLEYVNRTQVARLDAFYSTCCRYGTFFVIAIFPLKLQLNNDCMCMQRRRWEKIVTTDCGRRSQRDRLRWI